MTTGQDEPVAATSDHDPAEQASGSAPAGLPAPEVATLEKELEEVRAQAAENLDKFLRARAEVDNVRRRAEQDVSNAHKYAVERFASEIVAVRDSLDLARAVDLSGDNREVVQKMHEGLELTLKVLDDTFRKFGLTLVDPKGEKFDPNRHQAISVVESDEVAPNHVVTVVQKGYLLHERVLRPAMVVVAKAKAAGTPGTA
jgi:molecular chaperone GrpE